MAVSPVFTGWQFTNGLMQLLAGDEVTPITTVVGGRLFTNEDVATMDRTPEASMTMQWLGGDNTAFEQAYLDAWAGK